ncbi:GNAT family N-acetyltransferase [Tessaracoccus terricola]
MDLYVDEHLNWRALGEDDLADLDSLRAQIELLDDPVLSSVERLVGTDDVSGLPENSVGGWDNYGSLLAYGWNVPEDSEVPQVYLLGGVHPTHRYLGIGGSVLRWQERRAQEWRDEHRPGEAVWLGCYVDHAQTGLEKLLRKLGFEQERYFYDMHRSLEHLPDTLSVDGVRIERFDDRHAADLLDLHNICFRDTLGTRKVGKRVWHESLQRDSFRPNWSWVAIVDDAPVGYALSGLDEDLALEGATIGWTDRVGVHPDFRGRGIAIALLQRTLVSMAEDGCDEAGIGVDTTDPASPGLLKRNLGYEPRDGLVLMSKLVAPGNP